MLNLQYKGEYVHNPIRGKLDNIIDVMVANRGEQFRQQITERLNTAQYIFTRGDNTVLHEKVLEDYVKRIEELNNEFDGKYSFASDLKKFDGFVTLDEEGIYNKHYWLINNRILSQLGIIKDRNELITKKQDFFESPEFVERIKKEQAKFAQDEVYKEWKVLTEKKNELDSLIRRETDNLSNFDTIETSFKLKELERIRSLAKNDYMKSVIISDSTLVTWGKTNVGGCVSHFIDKNNMLVNALCCPNLFSLDTHVALHELGHVAESVILETNENTFIVKSGLEISEHCIAQNANTRNLAFDDDGNYVSRPYGQKRPYELLNEIIHDKFAKDEVAEYKKRHGKIGYAEDFVSQYSFGFDIFEPFIERHKNKLIECVHAENFSPIKEYFGFANFNKLAEIANDYVLEKNSLNNTLTTAKQDIENPEKANMADELQKIITETEAKIDQLRNKYLYELLKVDMDLHKRNGLDVTIIESQLADAQDSVEQDRLREEEEQRRTEEEQRRIEEEQRFAEEEKIRQEEERLKREEDLERYKTLFVPLGLYIDEQTNQIRFWNEESLKKSKKFSKLIERFNRYASMTNEKSILNELQAKTGLEMNLPSSVVINISELKAVKGQLSEEAIQYIRFVLGTRKLADKMQKLETKYENEDNFGHDDLTA